MFHNLIGRPTIASVLNVRTVRRYSHLKHYQLDTSLATTVIEPYSVCNLPVITEQQSSKPEIQKSIHWLQTMCSFYYTIILPNPGQLVLKNKLKLNFYVKQIVNLSLITQIFLEIFHIFSFS